MTLPNLYYLKYFSDAVELGSISAAAQKNLVTHPAVSKAIQVLESQMDIKLLAHKKKSFEVTAAGKLLARKAKTLLSASAQFTSMATDNQDADSGTITLGLSRSLAKVFLPALLSKMAKQLPGVQVHIQFGTTAQIGDAVARGAVDLGLTVGQQSLGTVKQTLLHQGQFVLIRPKNKPFGKNISNQNLILTEPRLETEIFKKSFFRHFKSSPVIKYQVSSWESILDLTEKGLGIGLVPELSLSKDLKKKLSLVKMNWFSCGYDIFLSRTKAAQKNPFLSQVIGIFESTIK